MEKKDGTKVIRGRGRVFFLAEKRPEAIFQREKWDAKTHGPRLEGNRTGTGKKGEEGCTDKCR